MRETERDREFHGEITSTSAQSEIFKPLHSHITINSIYCRCKLTWIPMHCTNKIRQTEMLIVIDCSVTVRICVAMLPSCHVICT